MYRFMWNIFIILAIGAGFYFYVQLIFTKVADPLYASLGLLMGCLFAAGISRELLIMTQDETEETQADITTRTLQ